MSIHLKNLKKGQLGELTIIVGDPGRVRLIEKHLTNTTLIVDSREFILINGYYNDKLVSVCSTGIGIGSTEIVVTELIENDAKQIVRAGGCGAWKEGIHPGDIIVNYGMARTKGMLSTYVPETYPAVADPLLVNKIYEEQTKQGKDVHLGLGLTSETYYFGQGRNSSIDTDIKSPNVIEEWTNYGVLNCEMETAVLFILGSIYNVPVANCLAVHVSRTNEKWTSDEEYEKLHLEMSKGILDALV